MILSHLHGDHFGGVPFLILDGQFTPAHAAARRGGTARRRGPRARGDGGVLPGLVDCPAAVRRPLRRAGRSRDADARVDLGHALRRGPRERRAALALRIAGDGKIVAYSGDTEWTDSLIDAARGADLFIAEALVLRQDGEVPPESRDRCWATAPSSSAGGLIVTHMGEDMLRRRDTLEVETAEDGKVVVVELPGVVEDDARACGAIPR